MTPPEGCLPDEVDFLTFALPSVEILKLTEEHTQCQNIIIIKNDCHGLGHFESTTFYLGNFTNCKEMEVVIQTAVRNHW
jgi:hypothetical protein